MNPDCVHVWTGFSLCEFTHVLPRNLGTGLAVFGNVNTFPAYAIVVSFLFL